MGVVTSSPNQGARYSAAISSCMPSRPRCAIPRRARAACGQCRAAAPRRWRRACARHLSGMGSLQTVFQNRNRLAEICASSPGVQQMDQILNVLRRHGANSLCVRVLRASCRVRQHPGSSPAGGGRSPSARWKRPCGHGECGCYRRGQDRRAATGRQLLSPARGAARQADGRRHRTS